MTIYSHHSGPLLTQCLVASGEDGVAYAARWKEASVRAAGGGRRRYAVALVQRR